MLPFFQDITHTLDMNERIAKTLGLKIEEMK